MADSRINNQRGQASSAVVALPAETRKAAETWAKIVNTVGNRTSCAQRSQFGGRLRGDCGGAVSANSAGGWRSEGASCGFSGLTWGYRNGTGKRFLQRRFERAIWQSIGPSGKSMLALFAAYCLAVNRKASREPETKVANRKTGQVPRRSPYQRICIRSQ